MCNGRLFTTWVVRRHSYGWALIPSTTSQQPYVNVFQQAPIPASADPLPAAQIVPTATSHLIRALSTWTAVQHITLTNLSFPSDALGLNTPFAYDAPLLPALPSLRTLYIGQATLLPPTAVAAMLARPGQDALAQVRLVDAYPLSIWGARIRRRDVEDGVASLPGLTEAQRVAVAERVRRIVSCEKKTGRLAGGDDDDAEGVLN